MDSTWKIAYDAAFKFKAHHCFKRHVTVMSSYSRVAALYRKKSCYYLILLLCYSCAAAMFSNSIFKIIYLWLIVKYGYV